MIRVIESQTISGRLTRESGVFVGAITDEEEITLIGGENGFNVMVNPKYDNRHFLFPQMVTQAQAQNKFEEYTHR